MGRLKADRRLSGGRVALLVGAMMVPVALAAQEPTPVQEPAPIRGRGAPLALENDTTHTVRRGDTLWEIARLYLGDPFLWPEIYRVNTDIVEDPHWIYPGEILKIPSLASIRGEPVAVEPEPIRDTTVLKPPPRVAGRQLFRAPAVRAGEFHAAPYVTRKGGPEGSGRIVAAASKFRNDPPPQSGRASYQAAVYVTPPDGTSPKVGDRYVSYILGPEIPGVGQVVIPTGIVRVERLGGEQATLARVVAQFGEVRIEQHLAPMERFTLSAEARPRPVAEGAETKVLWVRADPLLPTLQRYLVVDLRADDGVRLGDQISLYRPVARTEDRREHLPEQILGTAQIVRVTDRAATALIIDHEQPAIVPGMPARVSAKMP